MQTMAFEEAIAEELKMRNPRFEELFTKAGIIPNWIARGKTEGKIEGKIEGKTEERQYFLELINQGLSVEEIKQRLTMNNE